MRLARWLAHLAQQSLDLLAPRQCGACQALGVAAAFCPNCKRGVQPAPLPASGQLVTSLVIRPLGVYAPPLSLAIRRLKFAGRTDLVRPLAQAWWQAWGARLPAPGSALLVPVPLHPARLVERGYNQSALLASAFAKLAHLGVEHDLIHRIRATRQQAKLGKTERAHNLDAAFAVAPRRARAVRRPLILVDDVVTTGRTVQACRAALEGAGLSVREAWALALAPPTHS